MFLVEKVETVGTYPFLVEKFETYLLGVEQIKVQKISNKAFESRKNQTIVYKVETYLNRVKQNRTLCTLGRESRNTPNLYQIRNRNISSFGRDGRITLIFGRKSQNLNRAARLGRANEGILVG